MKIRISSRLSGAPYIPVGIIDIIENYSVDEIAEIANESGGLRDLILMGEWSGPKDYDPSGDDVYEILVDALTGHAALVKQ